MKEAEVSRVRQRIYGTDFENGEEATIQGTQRVPEKLEKASEWLFSQSFQGILALLTP